ncbi:flagellar FlbD family protein [Phosphitispora fastidiosa]|uniref:flagellar FlbD family protein n=1 Tax=Phosphitispora fastidiosa TaxID=2837202 RepID=UPI001E44E649|nr:flagellar FlbD family protein [Phosphitispora fastidiosa]MBU7008274.1 flagellar protein FlbD [Phosphitispora fastidiosa]
MIKVIRMNGSELVINPELIEFIEATPDTVLTLTTGKKFVLKDSVQELIDKVMEYRKSIGITVIDRVYPETGNLGETHKE